MFYSNNFVEETNRGGATYKKSWSSTLKLTLIVSLIAFVISLRYTSGKSFDLEEGIYAYCALLSNLYLLSLLLNSSLCLLLGWAKKVLIPIQILANSVFLFWIVCDTFVFQQYKFHINWAMIDLALGAGNQVFSLSGKLISLLVVSFVLCFGVVFISTKIIYRKISSLQALNIGHVVPILSFIVTGAISAISYAQNISKLLVLNDIPPIYYPIHGNRFLMSMGYKIETQSVTYDEAKTNSSFYYPLKEIKQENPQTNQNILIIGVDCLRSDTFTKEIFPLTLARKNNATLFNNHYSAGNATRVGIFTLFYGIPGRYWGNSLSSGQPPVLIETLRKSGYEFGIFASATLKSPEFYRTVFATIPNLRLYSDGSNTVERDIDCIEDFEEFLNKRENSKSNQPFFSFLFFDSLHAYSYPKEFEIKFKPNWETVNQMELNQDFDPTPYFNRYKNSAHFIDTLIDRVLHTLETKGLDKNTIIMITADHGEEFNDNKQNYWGHNGNFSEAQTHVPLMVLWPGIAPGEVNHKTNSFDISTTILERVLGVTTDRKYFTFGKDLWSTESRDPFMMGSYYQDAIVKGDRVLLIDKLGVPRTYTQKGWLLDENNPLKSELPFYFEAKSRFLNPAKD